MRIDSPNCYINHGRLGRLVCEEPDAALARRDIDIGGLLP